MPYYAISPTRSHCSSPRCHVPRATCLSYRLAVQVPVLDRCLGQLTARLRRLAAAGQPADLWALMQDLTLAETGHIAYGWVQLGGMMAALYAMWGL